MADTPFIYTLPGTIKFINSIKDECVLEEAQKLMKAMEDAYHAAPLILVDPNIMPILSQLIDNDHRKIYAIT